MLQHGQGIRFFVHMDSLLLLPTGIIACADFDCNMLLIETADIFAVQSHTIQLCPQFWQMATVLLKVLFPYIFKPPRFLPPNNKPHHQPIVSQYRGCSHQPKHNQYRQPWLFFAGWITTLFVPAPKFPVCSL